MTEFLQGNVIKFEGQFTDYDGTPKVPDVVMFKVYDASFEQIESFDIALKAIEGKVGEYAVQWVPSQIGTYYIEFYGEIAGMPSLNRQRVDVGKI